MNTKLINALRSFESAEAMLQEYENKNTFLGYVRVHAKIEGWSESHMRMAQLLMLAELCETLKSANEKLASMQPPAPIVLQVSKNEIEQCKKKFADGSGP